MRIYSLIFLVTGFSASKASLVVRHLAEDITMLIAFWPIKR